MYPSSSLTARGHTARRRLAGGTGVTLGIAMLAGVVMLFDDASSMSWLPPTPENLAAMHSCNGVAGTAASHACVETVIARVRSRDTERRLAANETRPELTTTASLR